MRILAAKDGLQPDDLALPFQCVQIVRHGHEIRFRRQRIAGIAPVGVGEQAELPGRHQLADARLYLGEVAGRGARVGRDRLRQRRACLRISLERRDDVHPVERVQVIEMHHVVVHELRDDHQVADQLGVGRDRVLECVLDRAHRSDSMHQRAHAADALRERPGIARIATLQDDLDAAHHGAGTGGARDHRAVELRLDAQVSLDAGDRVYDDGLGIHVRGAAPIRLSAISSSRLCGVFCQSK